MSVHFHRLIFDFFELFPDISQTRAAGPTQPILKTFPRTQHRQGRTRAFSASWYKAYTWVEYLQDSAFKLACRIFRCPLFRRQRLTQLLAFRTGKRAKYKDGGFRLHAKAEHHLNAMLAWTEHQRGFENGQSVPKR